MPYIVKTRFICRFLKTVIQFSVKITVTLQRQEIN